MRSEQECTSESDCESSRSRQIAAFLAAVTQNSVFRTEEKAVLSNFVFLGGGRRGITKKLLSQLKLFHVSFCLSVFPLKKKKKSLRRDGKSAASVRCWSSTHVGVLFDRHKQFFLQVNDGSNRLRQLQRVFVHKAIHCVAVHVLTHSVDL